MVTVACASAVWAQELDLLSERVVEALNEAIGRPAVTRLRPQAAPPRALSPSARPSAARLLCVLQHFRHRRTARFQGVSLL